MTEPTEVSFSTRLPRLGPITLALIIGALVVMLGGAALASGASSPSVAPAGAASTNAENDDGDTDGDEAERFDGRGGAGFHDITITGINGNSVSLKTDDGWTRTIVLTPTTKVTKAGQDIPASELNVGDEVRLRQTRNDDGTYTVTAVAVIVPTVSGTVTALTASGFTLDARGDTAWTITVNSGTAYTVGGDAGTKADVTVGARVTVAGTQGTGNTMTALAVRVKPTNVVGKVTAKTATTITVEKRNGTTVTVNVDADTTYRVRGVDNATLSNITVDMYVVVSGRQNANGSIDASAVGGGKFGRGEKPKPAAPDASSSPGTS